MIHFIAGLIVGGIISLFMCSMLSTAKIADLEGEILSLNHKLYLAEHGIDTSHIEEIGEYDAD